MSSRTVRPQSRITAAVRVLAWLAALGVIAIGALSLVGHVRHVSRLQSMVTGYPTTPPSSSLALVLGGLSLGLRLPRRGSRLRAALSVACALAMTAIGAMSLFQDVVEPTEGVDTLLAWMLGEDVAQVGRPSPLASVCLVLLGPALVLLGSRRKRATRDTLTVLAMLLALLGFNSMLLGPLLGDGTSVILSQRSMGLPASLALQLLCLGTLCARPEQGLAARVTRDSLGGFLARRLVPVAMLGPPLLAVALVLLYSAGVINHEAKLPLFATVVCAGGTGLVLMAARALDVLEAKRKQTTAALEASEARYRGLLETAPAPVLTVDARGLLRFVNAEAERVFGYRREELLGREVEVLVPEGLFGGRRLDVAPDERALHGLRKDGTEVRLEVRLSLLSDQEGTSLLALLRDVTERERYLAGVQRAHEETEVQRKLLQVVLEHAPVGVMFIDPLTGTLVSNRVAEALYGRENPAVRQSEYLPNLRHPDGRIVELAELPSTRAAATGRVVGPEEFLIVQPDGNTVPILSTAAPIPGPPGGSRGVVVSFQDLTTRYELDRLREEYVGLISHDLRGPLQVINLRASLLQRDLHARHLAREEGLTEAILRSVGWMSAMIEDLLEGSRLESRRAPLRREPKDLVRFLEEVLERDVPPDLRERFRLDVAGQVPSVWVDPARLERVLANLLGNAAKYSPPPLPVVVRARAHEAWVVVSVNDQGPGLAPEDAEHIFDKYYRTKQGSASDAKGLGLGLYISRLIVEAHGGRIWVESEPGKGAAFCFSLPVGPPREESVPGPRPDPTGPASDA
ncbi:PAS domain S-box protein [Pyxidicoccus parkwayensis]|uniref:histidine kinase n=1 Tax=Pyxidicoccus parkwayensis TaxID=2813578 RepID=A0ABX7NY50_9BACT|nr:ATP-binding protein [Pyxidicoccus parkwaysis]QSQ21008.1 PAS domain S-box protein [Pyxidicoccus parkwaysis]